MNEDTLKRVRDKCATGEPLTEAEARWVVGRVVELEKERDRLLVIVAWLRHHGSKSSLHIIEYVKRMMAFLGLVESDSDEVFNGMVDDAAARGRALIEKGDKQG